MAFIELVVKQALAKIINCYCKECVGDIDIPTAPKLISFDDTKLMNPNGCMCFDCVKELYPDLNYKSCARSYEYKDTGTSEFTCWCNGCFGHINSYDCKVEEFKLDVVYKTIKISQIGKLALNYQLCDLDVSSPPLRVFIIHSTYHNEYYTFNNESKIYNAMKGRDGATIVDSFDHDVLKIGAGRVIRCLTYLDLGRRVTFGWVEYSTFNIWTISYNIPYEIAYDEEFIKKVLYYGEYRGYRHNKYVILGPPLPVECATFKDEIPWGDVTFMMLIDYFRSAKVEDLDQGGIDCYHKVKAQYCFECNKYIGACLGHEIPDHDEYKYIVNRPNFEKRIEYLEQQIKALKSRLG